MITVNFTEFRQHMKRYFEAARAGERVRILRRGKPIAEVQAPDLRKKVFLSKKPGLRLKIEGVSPSKEIIRERRRSGW